MSQLKITAGLDLGDRFSYMRSIETDSGEVIEESRIPTNPEAFEARFAGSEPMRIAVEARTHSPWVNRIPEGCGHEVLLANARKLRLIHGEGKKNDKLDGENLARLARARPQAALASEASQRSLGRPIWCLSARAKPWSVAEPSSSTTFEEHSSLLGPGPPKCSADNFHERVTEHVPEPLRAA